MGTHAGPGVPTLRSPISRPARRRPSLPLTIDQLRRIAVGVVLSIGIFFIVKEAVDRLGARGAELPVGVVVLALSLLAVVLWGVWRSTRVGVMVWMFASMFTVVGNEVGLHGIERLAFAALAAGWFIGVATGKTPLKRFGMPEGLMALFVVVQVVSAVAPHELAGAAGIPPSSYIIGGIFLPMAAFVIASQSLADGLSVRMMLWYLVGIGLYLAITCLLQKFGGRAFVFPPQINDAGLGVNPERARGPLLNSAADGILMTFALSAALFLGQQRGMKLRWLALLTAIIMPLAIYTTVTRAIYLGAAIVIIGGAVFARGWRRWHVILLTGAVAAVALNYKTFLSDDRASGGVGSASEIESRFNDWATAWWGFTHKPTFGWGIGRFPELNTLHHQAWPGVAWKWGWGYISHNTYLAYAAEIGVIGAGLWIAVLVAIVLRTRTTWRRLPRHGVVSRGFVLAFWLAMASMCVNAMVIDVRLFPAILIPLFAWAGVISGLADRSPEELAAMNERTTLLRRPREPVGIPPELLTGARPRAGARE